MNADEGDGEAETRDRDDNLKIHGRNRGGLGDYLGRLARNSVQVTFSRSLVKISLGVVSFESFSAAIALTDNSHSPRSWREVK